MKLARETALRNELLHAGEIGSHDRPSGIEDAIVEELNLVFAEQMRTDLLEPLRGDQFVRQPLLIVQVIRDPGKAREALYESTALCIESARRVEQNDPDHSDRFSTQMKWDQQRFGDRQGNVPHILGLTVWIGHEQKSTWLSPFISAHG